MDRRRLFIWRRFAEWIPPILDWSQRAIPSEALEAAQIDPDKYFYGNSDSAGVSVELARRFSNAYSRIRLFHACRPTDIGSYFQNGLRPLSIHMMNDRAKGLFLSGGFPDITEGRLHDAITDLKGDRRDGKLYLCLDDVELVNYAPHYHQYGSEYLHAIAVRLSKDCVRALQSLGTPTIFVCDVPTGYLDDADILALVTELTRRAILETQNPGDYHGIDHTVAFHEPLPASVITSYYHPPA